MSFQETTVLKGLQILVSPRFLEVYSLVSTSSHSTQARSGKGKTTPQKT